MARPLLASYSNVCVGDQALLHLLNVQHQPEVSCPSNYCVYRSFGLWLDSELDKGTTSSCTAFNNIPLTGSGEPHSQFTCAVVEVYNCD